MSSSSRLIRAREERFADLDFRAYRRACKADHTRRRATPWYIEQGNVLDTRRIDNSRFAVWSRQVKRYAQWYVQARLGLSGVFVTGVYKTPDGFVWAMLSGAAPVKLPSHTHLDFHQPGVAEAAGYEIRKVTP